MQYLNASPQDNVIGSLEVRAFGHLLKVLCFNGTKGNSVYIRAVISF